MEAIPDCFTLHENACSLIKEAQFLFVYVFEAGIKKTPTNRIDLLRGGGVI